MKKFTKFFAIALSVFMLLGTLAVSADDSADTASIVEVYLSVEGPDGLTAFTNGVFISDGSLTAGEAIASLLEADYPEIEFAGLEDGYISSLNGISAGVFGGYDGWLYIVKSNVIDENGDILFLTEIPAVGMNDYIIEYPCHIIVYYGDYGCGIAGYYAAEDGMIKLVSYTPVYDEEYNLVGFEEAPLAGGSFVFTPYFGDSDEVYIFEADENGITELDAEFKAVPNGLYYGSVGKQSEETAEIDGVIASKPEVARYTFIYYVDNDIIPTDILMNEEKIIEEIINEIGEENIEKFIDLIIEKINGKIKVIDDLLLGEKTFDEIVSEIEKIRNEIIKEAVEEIKNEIFTEKILMLLIGIA